MRPLYIFDLDGTLADIAHRRHHVMGDNHDWPAFYAECDKDTPNWPVLITLDTLKDKAEVWIWSGRSDEVHGKTLDWLYEHTPFEMEQLGRLLRMRLRCSRYATNSTQATASRTSCGNTIRRLLGTSL